MNQSARIHYRSHDVHLTRTRNARQYMGRLGNGSAIITSGVSAGAGAGAAAGTAAATGAAFGSVIPGLGTAVGAVVAALIGGLLSGHFAREKGAQTENAFLNSIMPAIVTDIQSVFTALNAGQIGPSDAQTVLAQIQANFWQAAQQYESGPGQAGGPQMCPAPGPAVTCDSSCTASCCVGCNSIRPWIQVANGLISAGGGTYNIPAGGPSKYGYSGSPAFTLTYTPPPGGVTGSASGAVAALTGSTLSGLPLWVWIAAGLGLFLVLRK